MLVETAVFEGCCDDGDPPPSQQVEFIDCWSGRSYCRRDAEGVRKIASLSDRALVAEPKRMGTIQSVEVVPCLNTH